MDCGLGSTLAQHDVFQRLDLAEPKEAAQPQDTRLTREFLRAELQRQLSELAARMLTDVREELRRYHADLSKCHQGAWPIRADVALGKQDTEQCQNTKKKHTFGDTAAKVLEIARKQRLRAPRSRTCMMELEQLDHYWPLDTTPKTTHSLTPKTKQMVSLKRMQDTILPHHGEPVEPVSPIGYHLAGRLVASYPCRRRFGVSRRAHSIVQSRAFEICVGAVILLNAIFIAIMVDMKALNPEEQTPAWASVIELCFLIFFVMEITIRFVVCGRWFFRSSMPNGKRNPNLYWNILDSIVVFLGVVELCLSRINTHIDYIGPVTVVRLIRLFRLARIVRLLKVLRVVRDLRIIANSIWNTLSIFVWSSMALGFLAFMCSVYFTELVMNYSLKTNSHNVNLDEEALHLYFGTLSSTMLSLVQAVSGGIDWSDLYSALLSIDEWYLGTYPLVLYLAFAIMALTNVINGIFLDAALGRARGERDFYLLANARVIFRRADQNQSGMITWPDFEQALEHTSGVNAFFQSVDIDTSEAKNLFDLLDESGDGVVSADEFLNGCLRVQGPAKALDLLVLSREVRQLFEIHAEHSRSMTEILGQHSALSRQSSQRSQAHAPLPEERAPQEGGARPSRGDVAQPPAAREDSCFLPGQCTGQQD